MSWGKDTTEELELDYEDAQEFARQLGNCAAAYLEEGEKGYVELTRGISNVEVSGQYGSSFWKADTSTDSDAIKYLEAEGYLKVGSML